MQDLHCFSMWDLLWQFTDSLVVVWAHVLHGVWILVPRARDGTHVPVLQGRVLTTGAAENPRFFCSLLLP